MRSNDIDRYVECLKIQNVKEFGCTLKCFEKEFGKYSDLGLENAERLFTECLDIYLHSDDRIQRFNALRLAKFVCLSEKFIRKYFRAVWDLYENTIFSDDGNIRNAGIWLLDRFIMGLQIMRVEDFGLIKKPTVPEDERIILEKFYVERFVRLIDIQEDYINNSFSKISKRDRGDGLTIPFSFDTKDIYLKTIRRGMEKIHVGEYFEELLEKHGYCKVEPEKEPADEHHGIHDGGNNCVICDMEKELKKSNIDMDFKAVLRAVLKEREG